MAGTRFEVGVCRIFARGTEVVGLWAGEGRSCTACRFLQGYASWKAVSRQRKARKVARTLRHACR